jgi:hypothetical protein
MEEMVSIYYLLIISYYYVIIILIFSYPTALPILLQCPQASNKKSTGDGANKKRGGKETSQPSIMDIFPVNESKARGARVKRRRNNGSNPILDAQLVPRARSKASRRVRALPTETDENPPPILPEVNATSRIESKVKASRTNWSRDQRLADAVKQWDTNRPNGDKGKPITMRKFALSKEEVKTKADLPSALDDTIKSNITSRTFC